MLELRPGDLCAYEDDGGTPEEILGRVLIYLYQHDDYPDEGIFLCNDGTVDFEYLAFVRKL